MKKILFLLLCTSIAFANDKKTPSVIKEVVVYLQGAQLTREAAVTIPKGVSEILIPELSPLIEESSIQIGGLKNASILSISYKINYLEKKADSDKIAALEKTLNIKKRALAVLKNSVAGLQEEEALLYANKNLKSDQQSITLSKLTEFSRYFRERVAAIRNAVYDANIEIESINKEIRPLNKELNQLKGGNEEKRGEIVLKINAPSAVSLNLSIKYNVAAAGWFPTYDIKAESLDQPLGFYYKAHVYQQTGTDWNNVKITLSTGDPSVNNNRPDVSPHYLNFVNPYAYRRQNSIKKYNYKYNPTVRRVSGRVLDESGMPLPRANVVVKGTANGTQTDFDGNYTLDVRSGQELVFSYIGQKDTTVPIYANTININLEEDVQALEEVVITGYGTKQSSRMSGVQISQNRTPVKKKVLTTTGDVKQDNMTNTVFKITKQYSIPSLDDITVIGIDKFNPNAVYEYFTAPLLNQNVFLTAKLKQWEQFNIIPGEASVYFEGNYAGKTFIDPFQTEEELIISLGVDPNVVVERKQLNNLKDKSFTGNTRIVNKAYEISIKNNKNTLINLVVMDRIPISQNKEIKVDDIEYSQAEYDDKKRLITWRLKLNSNSSVKKQLSYRLKYPKNRAVNHQ